MKRLFLALASLLAAVVFALAATTTTPVTLSTSAYTDLGAGPMYLGAYGGAVVFQIADSQPSATSGGMVVQAGDKPVEVRTVAHVWAITTMTGAKALVASGTGLTATLGQSTSTVGAASFASGQQAAVANSSTLIVAARTGFAGTGRVSVTLYNQGTVTVYYGPSGVTTSTGTPLLPGGSRTIATTAAVYGVVASGTGSVAYDETY